MFLFYHLLQKSWKTKTLNAFISKLWFCVYKLIKNEFNCIYFSILGPLTADVDGRVVLVGVASWNGGVCGNPDFPSVFARVSTNKDWILSNSDAGDYQWNLFLILIMFDHSLASLKWKYFTQKSYVGFASVYVFKMQAIQIANINISIKKLQPCI